MTLILLLTLMLSGSFALSFQIDNHTQINTINTLKKQNQLTRENILHFECRKNISICEGEVVMIEIVEQLIDNFQLQYQVNKVTDINRMRKNFQKLPENNPVSEENPNSEIDDIDVEEQQEPEILVQYQLIITPNYISLIKNQQYLQRWLIEH